MERVCITREQVEAIYDELDRRMDIDIRDDLFGADEVLVKESLQEKLQGVYATLMTISANWSDVRYWCGKAEDARRYFA